MRIPTIFLALAATATLAGCLDTPEERALGGAVAGGLLADATDNNVLAGAALGAAGGALSCGIAGLPRCQ